MVHQDLAALLIQLFFAVVSFWPTVPEFMTEMPFLQDLRITKVFNLRVSGGRNSNSTM